jgi:N-acetylneuraminate synthase
LSLPYVIAEIGVAHEGSVILAEQMIAAAAAAGANAVKFQAYKAAQLAAVDSPTYFSPNGMPATTQREFFARYDGLDRKDYEHLATVAKDCGVDFGCTVFQPEDVAWVDPLVEWHKVASADIDNWPLLDAVARTGKPVFVSTGAATWLDVEQVQRRYAGIIMDLRVMHCVLAYPTLPEQANLSVLGPGVVGYSCHVPFNLDVLTTAWLLGAHYIEKHFTLDKTQAGNDHYHSMDPDDLRHLRARLAELLPLLGDGDRRVVPDHEHAARQHARRSWAARRDLDVGHVLAHADLIALRPGTGVPVSQDIAGRTLTAPVAQGQLIPAGALAPVGENPHIFA